ncbi:DUF881 domain-containing protein [uncultured Cellulomonas sp.]|uniref:DUF881 domain-containing protein n=1 Tax=uncultured Cellulomonas sp. TaxID=189682 RepID=UPI002633D5A1|nr:DUF881 domain-containing protein [uncultured Cellulomonas sp.]
MTLLNEVMHRPLDPGYAEATERRRRGEAPALPAWRRALLAAVAVALGVAMTTAASTLRAPRPEAVQARTLLTAQIAESSAAADALQTRTDAMSREIAELRTEALSAQDPALLETLARDELTSGTAAVTGPGLRLTLADAPVVEGDPDGADLDFRVQDVDVQVVVNGLWAAGAEAVAIDGQRLTVLTAIRTAGSAILVDLAPLSSPYVVEAIGDPTAMQTAFARTAAGQHLSSLQNTYGITSRVSAEDALALPGSSRTRLRFAEPVVPEPADPELGPAPDPELDPRAGTAAGRGGTSRTALPDVASSGTRDEGSGS